MAEIVETAQKRDKADDKAKEDMLQFFKERKLKRKRATLPANLQAEAFKKTLRDSRKAEPDTAA